MNAQHPDGIAAGLALGHGPRAGPWDGVLPGVGSAAAAAAAAGLGGGGESVGDEPENLRPASRLGRQPSAMSGGTTSPSSAGGSAQGGSSSVFALLPPHLVAPILSFLPLPSLLAASRVCTEWRAEIARAGAIAVCDLGAFTQGIVPPPPRIVAGVARAVGARDVALGGCLWLTTGALLTALGVPVGASAGPLMPAPTMALPPQATATQRDQAIYGWIESARGIATRRRWPRGGPAPTRPDEEDTFPGSRNAIDAVAAAAAGSDADAAALPLFHQHSFLRAFVDEVSAGELAALRQAAAEEGRAPGAGAALRSLLRAPFIPVAAFEDSFAKSDAMSTWQPWWADIDATSDAVTATATSTSVHAALLDTTLPLSTPSAPSTTMREVAVSAVSAELVKQRSALQVRSGSAYHAGVG